MKKRIGLILLTGMLMAGCTSTGYEPDPETLQEIEDGTNKFLSIAEEGNLESMESYMITSMQEVYAPMIFYNSLTTQYPESSPCAAGAKETAEYILSRMYRDVEILKTDISQDGSEARVHMTWTGIDPSKVDTNPLRETIEGILEEVYEKDAEQYETDRYTFGDDYVNKEIQDAAFESVFKEVKKLYEDASDKEMNGILAFTYTSDGGWKVSGIYEYLPLLYKSDGTYDWEFEKAQETFKESKTELESTE